MSQSNERLFESEKYALDCCQEYLEFTFNNTTYQLTSHPFEPCLYIRQGDKLIRIIHNAFTIEEMIEAAKGIYQITSVTGTKYDIEAICEVLSHALKPDFFETDLSTLEAKLRAKKELEPIAKSAINTKIQQTQNTSPIHITELVEDLFYQEYLKYEDAVLDYCIVKTDSDEHEKWVHQQVVLFAMNQWQASLKEEYEIEIKCYPERMKAEQIKAKDFFEQPVSNKKSYRYLFLNPPHGCDYTEEAFQKLNHMLFPNGLENLEIYDWSTDWSNYFDDGNEWWGARCVSIYDKSLDRFVVIGASATD